MKLSVTGFIKHAIIFAMNGILPEFITYFSLRNVISYKIDIFDEIQHLSKRMIISKVYAIISIKGFHLPLLLI